MAMPAQHTEWTVDMVRALPDDGNRYEVIDGELFVTPAPSMVHQCALLELVPLVNDLPVREWTKVGRLLLTVEVLSPSTEHADRGRKRMLYQEKAVPEYWIVNTADRVIERWRFDDTPAAILNQTLEWQPDSDAPSLVVDLPAYFDRVHGLV